MNQNSQSPSQTRNCVVTAYYKIRSKFDYAQYMHWINNFLNTVACDVILFTTHDMAQIFRNFGKTNVTVVEQEMNELYFHKNHIGNFEQQWLSDPIKNRRSPELYILWYNKLKFIEHAHSICGDKYTNYIWCDIGAFREEHLFAARKSFGMFTRKLDKMTVLAIRDPQPKDFVLHPDGLYGRMTNDEVFLGGGILALPHDKVSYYNRMLTDTFALLCRSDRFFGCDQRVYACMYGAHPNDFTIVKWPERYGSDIWFYMLDYLSNSNPLLN